MREHDKGPAVDPEVLRAQGYEREDLNLRPILRAVAILFVFVAAVAGLVVALYFVLIPRPAGERPGRPIADTRRLPPAPMLQPEPTLDMRRFREAEDARLNSYGWVDRSRGVAHIPVDRAAEMVLERGLPVRAASATPGTTPAAPVTQTEPAQSTPSTPPGPAAPSGAPVAPEGSH